MKNILSVSLLTAIGAISTLPANAQIYKGAAFLGGSLGISQKTGGMSPSAPAGENSAFSAFVSPKFGCFVTNNLAIGVNLHFGYAHQEYGVYMPYNPYDPYNPGYGYPTSLSQNSYSTGGSFFMRYTKFIIPKFGFFTEGSIGYTYTNTKSDMNYYYPIYESPSLKSNGFNVAIIPGIIFMPTPRLGFEASYGRLGYGYTSYRQSNSYYFGPGMPQPASNSSEFGLDLSSATLTLGFNYYFGNRPRVKVEESDED